MRKIKFRAWDKKNKKMVYSDDGSQEYGWFTGNDGCMLCVRIEEEKDIKLNNIMQYAGFKDKNGKEIYEGDILEIVNNLNETTKKLNTHNVIVKYKEGSIVATWEDELDGEIFNHFNSYNTPIVTFEIIGNIYETQGIFKRIKEMTY